MTHRRFSFGRNWQKYLDEKPAGAPNATAEYVASWLGPSLQGSRVVDIGSGQGLTSLAVFRSGARVLSFDLDPLSVAATQRLRDAAGAPESWTVVQGSVLDARFMGGIDPADVVISWGVLHHTGRLWDALDAAAALVRPGGLLWIALYHKTAASGRSMRTKKFYNRLPEPGKFLFRGAYEAAKMAKHLVVHRSLVRFRNYEKERGMTWRRDVEDWLGGLPYEVSSPGEVLARLRPVGFVLERLDDAAGEGGNDVYLLRRASG
jgi:2-polyprenyl-6-hydroxyphenyl methylase/3-demethylubiquinone-9 3-methyltransferase